MRASGGIVCSGIIDGQDGKGITSADVMFCIISGTGTPADTANWQTTVAQLNLSDSTKEYYLWQATYITYTDNTHAYTGKVCLGQVKDFASVVEQYARGTASAADSNTWQNDTPPAPQKGSYLWTRTKLVFANGNISFLPSEAGYCLGYYGEDGQDAHEVNPNILLRTIFDRGIDQVKEAWSADWNYVKVDAATDTVVEGRKCIRIDADTPSVYKDFKQDVYARVRPGTWYTLSFNYFATAAWETYIYPNTNAYACIDQSAGIYVDGILNSSPTIHGKVAWPGRWDGARHSVTFKTKADSFINEYVIIIFRALAGGQVAITMPKLEAGQVATAYMAHEDDLRGDDGQSITGKTGRMCYIAGEYSDDIEYICDATQTVAVEVPIEGSTETELYYLALEPEGNNTASNWTWNAAHTSVLAKVKPTDKNQSVWKEGLSNYNLIRTKYLFADFAKLGSAVVSGDWLFSTNGSIDGTEYNSTDVNTPATIGSTGIIAYTAFNGVDPMGAGVRILQGAGQSLYYTSSNSQYFQSFTLVRGRKVHFSATGRSYYSTTNQTSLELYLRTTNANGSYAYTKKATLFSFNYGTAAQQKTADFTPTETGTYVFRQINSQASTTSPQGSSSSTITAITATEYSFRPSFAVDLLTGKSYMTTGYLRGGTRSPFVYNEERQMFDDGFSDNIALYSYDNAFNFDITYELPWDKMQAGRRVTITNYKWKNNIANEGFAKCVAPTGKYFYEDGAKKSSIRISREAVELLGFGDDTDFYGWIVMNRIDLGTKADYGHPLCVIAKGKVTGGTSPTVVGMTCYGKTPIVTRTAQGVYRLSGLGVTVHSYDTLIVMVSGVGTVDGKPVAASWTGSTDGIEVQTFSTAGLVDGSFTFMLMDSYDFSSLDAKITED